jgi:hypothetical protein
VCLSTYAQQPPQKEPAAIQDNSFLIEEAYNQEAGIVHTSTLSCGCAAAVGLYLYAGIAGQKHKAPVELHACRAKAGRSRRRQGLGDILLNYRYQLIGDGNAKVAVSPRFSVLLPTGNARKGFGAGAPGVQLNLPVSVVLSRHFVTHWNAGAT